MRLYLLLVLAACNVANFETFSQLGDLRIMAIVADTPEVDGNRTDDVQVMLTPYISDIDAAGRKFVVTVVTCLDPGLSQGAMPRCAKPQIVAYPNANTFDTRRLAEDNYTGAMDAVTVTIANPKRQITARSEQQKYNGINYLVIFNLVSGSTNLTAVKAITITTRQMLNSNPEIDTLSLDHALATTTRTPTALDISFTTTGKQERYQEMAADGSVSSQSEAYFITWFYSTGKVKPSRVLLDQSASYTASADSDTLVAVVKDRRGGSDVRIMQF